jgi:hypothetical protein
MEIKFQRFSIWAVGFGLALGAFSPAFGTSAPPPVREPAPEDAAGDCVGEVVLGEAEPHWRLAGRHLMLSAGRRVVRLKEIRLANPHRTG